MSSFSIGQMNQLGDAFEAAGFTSAELTRLGQSGWLLGDICGILRSTHGVHPVNHIVNLSSPCKLPFANAERVSPAKSGIVKLERNGDDLCLDGKKINLFLSERQKDGRIIDGHDLRKELEARGDNVSASILDACVENPALWPESWKKKNAQGNTIYVFFLSDVFCSSDGDLCVRCGYWREGKIVSDYDWLDRAWYSYFPSASSRKLGTLD